MDLYEKLNLEPTRLEPAVWVSRLVIYERILPDPVVIRDIALTRGLNLIWAEEPEDDSPSAAITGHSAGKTTFCRLVRYALGERTFGTKAATELIRRAFPGGYLAAELNILGRKWAVRRPLGSGKMSYIEENVSIEELLERRGRSVTQERYSQELGLEDLLSEIDCNEIVQTGEKIQWAHILAWCTRDQEARFQNIHDWRSPRSESDTPSFRFPKAGPLFAMRTVLGLFLPDELKGEKQLAKLHHEKDQLTKDIEEKRREPQFRVNLYDSQLRQSLKSILPDEPDIESRPFQSEELFSEDLKRLTAKAQGKFTASIESEELELPKLQARIDELGAEIGRWESEIAALDVLYGLNSAAASEIGVEPFKREEQRQKINKYHDIACPFTDVILRDCSYVQERHSVLQITELQDAQAMKLAQTRRDEECKKIEDKKNELRMAIKRYREERQSILKKRDALMSAIQDKRDSIRKLQNASDELVRWVQIRDKSGTYEDLDTLRLELESVEDKIIEGEKELSDLLRQHDESRERLAAIFSRAVQSVLPSAGYDGQVSLENRELSFHITHGVTMSGEAIETLSVLLADLACLIHNTIFEKARLPGFLMHDSPREADLGIRIYRSFIRFAASVQEHFGGPDKCPFQYLITTTTAPPDELQSAEHLKLSLNASSAEGLLLRRNIALETEHDKPLLQ